MAEERFGVIRKEGNKWCLFTKDGKRKLGCHNTKEKAEEQERAIMANEGKQLRALKIQLLGAQIRTAIFEDREHIVVPVIALMEGVIHAVNADTPELVTVKELSKAPAGWNGRPVVADHPLDDSGQRVSANDPRVLEQNAFGHMFNTIVEDKKLKTEAWLDPRKATRVGDRALKVMERIQKGEMVEVSVGVFVSADGISGVHEGKPYQAVWREIVPDHLAFLSENTEGACSIEMGCGAPRAAAESCPFKKEVGKNMDKDKDGEKKTLWESLSERVRDLMSFRSGQEESLSDVDMRSLLDEALRMVEPGYLGVEAVFAEEKTVVFAVAPGEVLQFFKQSFSVAESGAVTLKEDKEEVKPVTRFEPVTAAQSQEKNMCEKKLARIKALIDNPKSQWIADDEKYLGEMSDERLTGLEAALVETEPEPKTEPVKTEPVKTEPVKTEPVTEPPEKTEEKIISDLPQNLQVDIAEARAVRTAKKADLVTKLVTAQDAYTKCELEEMSIIELEKLGKVVAIVKPDYSGQGTPRTTEGVPPPPSLKERLAAQK